MARNAPGRNPSQVTLKTVFTVCFGVLAVAALVVFLLRTEVALTLALGAGMVAVAMNHGVEALTRRGLRRNWAVLAVVFALLALGTGLSLVLVPPVISQAKALIAEAPALWMKVRQTRVYVALDARFDLSGQLKQSVPAAAGAVAPVLVAIGSALSAVGGLVTLLLLAIFMLLFGRELLRAAIAEAAARNRGLYERVVEKIYRSVGGYVAGLIAICSINATLTTTFLAITGMPFFLPLGILSGTSSAVPYAGPLVAGVTITLLALITGGPLKALITGVYFILYGQLEGNVLSPLIFRRTVHINPLVTTLAILFMAEFMGLPGAIIAVPAAATAQIVVREILSLRAEQQQARDAAASD
ncbi:MAG TPA: AI-2E family transporter [Myxococcales bacterium]|nr:AI-2E family transporter [Myxococcales bacterium]